MKRCVLATLLFIPIFVFGGDLEDGRAAISSRDYTKARTLLTPLAEAGNPVAQNALGVLYTEGWGVKQDHPVALAWYRRAANSGDARGQYNLGRMYDNGWGVQKDYREAVKWYRMAAEQKYSQAESILGAMYATGDGVDKDYGEAMKWYKRAAEQGDPEAQRRVGFMYVEGQGVPQNYAEAVIWFQKGADQGHTGSLYWLGRLYYEGKGVERNRDKAETFLKQAAKQGSKEATEYLVPSTAPGKTAASPLLQREILQFILALDSDKDCDQRKLVNTELVIPPTSANSFTAVERWTLDRCGKLTPYRVVMNPSPRGGTDFKVGPER